MRTFNVQIQIEDWDENAESAIENAIHTLSEELDAFGDREFRVCCDEFNLENAITKSDISKRQEAGFFD